jgi:hypothetical protein
MHIERRIKRADILFKYDACVEHTYRVRFKRIGYKVDMAMAGPCSALCTATIADLLYFPFDYPFINPTLRIMWLVFGQQFRWHRFGQEVKRKGRISFQREAHLQCKEL